MITEIKSITEISRHLENIDVVIFDLDDTLYPEREYVYSGFDAVGELFPKEKDLSRKLKDAFLAGRPAIDEVLTAEGLMEFKDKALHAYRFQTPVISLYPGVKEVLKSLQGYHLSMITDGRPEGQRAKIRALGIEEYFEEIIVTDELGGTEFRKPNPISFTMIHDKFGVPYERMMYIGDNAVKDFKAPETLGMKSLYFKNPDGLYYGRQ